MSAILKIMPIELCGAVRKCMAHPSSYKSYITNHSHREPSMLRVADHALAQLEAARKVDVERHEKNAEALANNQVIRGRVLALMAEVGMPEKFVQRDPNSRARVPKSMTLRAGYLTDLDRECKVDDGYAFATTSYEQMLKEYQDYRKKAEGEAAREKNLAEIAERERLEKRRADLELVTIIQRYRLPIESEWGDVLEALRTRDQRLDLAVAMEDVRSDWNDGCGAVEFALSRFTIRDNEDKEIAADVLGCTRDFEDGRVFRDTTWSYDALYASAADQQLAADVQAARSHARRA